MRFLAGRQIIKDGRGSNRSTTDGDKLTQTASLENLAEPSVLVNPEKRQICERSIKARRKTAGIFTLL
ncbi:MAG: hypothetical protein E2591_03320 [Achromobacter sp.]|uniref:Uncharacterized protein n=1 Tax=Achromobacter piechaudii ATCC 43553 TaxID=742159 RepID=D4XF39_9BURK|nr:hypothetical protein HMPREF0004_4086 [Achromobacter piechaudii ATCC 43553]MPS77089.1 hypothetical protein [Achromobacter sp.]